MGHTDHDLVHAHGAGLLNDPVEQRNEALAALQPEAFHARVLVLQVQFQTLGGGQFLHQAQAVFGAARVAAAAQAALDLLLKPGAFGGGQVVVLEADGAAVGVPDLPDHFTQGALVRAVLHLRIQVSFGQAVELRLQLGNHGNAAHLQGVGSCGNVAVHAVRRDQSTRSLLSAAVLPGRLLHHDRPAPAPGSQVVEGLLHGTVRGFLHAAANVVEVRSPVTADTLRVVQVLFVQFLNEGRVPAPHHRLPLLRHTPKDTQFTLVKPGLLSR